MQGQMGITHMIWHDTLVYYKETKVTLVHLMSEPEEV